MKDWFLSLERREQSLLTVGGLALVITLFYLLVTEPLHQSLQQAESRHQGATRLIAEVREQAAEVRQLRGAAADSRVTARPANLLPLLEQSLRDAGIADAMKRMTPDASAGVRLQFDQVAFNDLYGWLEGLQQNHAIRVESLTLNASREPGRVRAILSLE